MGTRLPSDLIAETLFGKTRRERGRQVYFRANPESQVYKELRGLLLKTAGVAGVLRTAR